MTIDAPLTPLEQSIVKALVSAIVRELQAEVPENDNARRGPGVANGERRWSLLYPSKRPTV